MVVVHGLSCPAARGIFLDQDQICVPCIVDGILTAGPAGKSSDKAFEGGSESEVRVLVGIGQWGAGLGRMGRNGGLV